jgi:CHAT domain-containing protein
MISVLRTATVAVFLVFATGVSGDEVPQSQVPMTEAQRQMLEQYRKQIEQAKANLPEIFKQNIDSTTSVTSRLSKGEISYLYLVKMRDVRAGSNDFVLSTMRPDFNIFSNNRDQRIVGKDKGSVPSTLVPVALQTELLALEGIEKEHRVNNGSAVDPWLKIATALTRVGAHDDAARVYQHVLAYLSESSEDTERIRFDLLGQYCGLLLSMGRMDEVLDLSQEAKVAAKSWGEKMGSQGPAVANEFYLSDSKMLAGRFSSVQGTALAAMGRWAEAEALHLSNAELLPAGSKAKLMEQGRAATAMLHQEGKGHEAERLIREQLSVLPSINQFAQTPELDGYQHLQRALLTAALAHAELIQNKPKEAEVSARIALALIEKVSTTRAAEFSSRQASSIFPYVDYLLAKSIRLQGRRDEALNFAKQAFKKFESSDMAKKKPRFVDSPEILQEILLAEVPLANLTGVVLTDSLFQALQKWHESTSGKTIEQLFKRFSSDEGKLATLVREQQDLVRRRSTLNIDVARSIPLQQGGASASDIADVEKKLESVNQRLAAEFPSFFALTTNAAANLKDTQSALGPDDALLAWFIGDEGAWIAIVRAGDARIIPLSVRASALRKQIQSLRKVIEPDESGLGVFPAKKAYDLYRELLAPTEPYLKEVKHLYSIVDATVSDLPLSVLLTSEPVKQYINPGEVENLKAAPWVIKQYSITALPSVSSLHMLRAILSSKTARAPFLGVGDPLLGGKLSGNTGMRSAPQVRFRGGLADVKQVALLVPLPETADELKSMGRALSSDGGVLMLGKQATERAVKSAPLDRYRVLGFATHGLIAGEFAGIREPGLVLTPPTKPSDEDDGVLISSEVAQLKLNADWVILSACNTGAGDGSAANDALGGLAKSFFYAGAKSLLVSHWKVASTATVALTTETVRLSEKPGISKAEAHRQAMLSMINSGDAIKAHPSVWAAFFLVGDGGLNNKGAEKR